MPKNFEIRNSTAEFLIFQIDSKDDGIQVVYKDETIWATQKAMAELFEVKVPTINEHISNIYKSGELIEEATIRNFRIVQQEGKRSVEREFLFYNLDAIISVGYRVNSIRATQFRQWCTSVLRQIVKPDVSIAKNYLTELKLDDMGRLVNSVLDIAERMARRHIPMTMEDWAKRIDMILEAGDNAILTSAGTVTTEFAKTFAETEFEKYRIIQDRLFSSDFDKFSANNLPPFDIDPLLDK